MSAQPGSIVMFSRSECYCALQLARSSFPMNECPPVGRHRYFHKIFALDTMLPELGYPGKAALEKAMRGPILAHAELVGLYQRRR